jgi:AraC-like DNA-binding protein
MIAVWSGPDLGASGPTHRTTSNPRVGGHALPAPTDQGSEVPQVDAFLRDALAIVVADVSGSEAPEAVAFTRVLTLLFSQQVHTGRGLAVSLGVRPSTLLSRFFRAGLPSPKRYVALARLIAAARLLEGSDVSIASAASALGYASPQGFHRHVRLTLGMTARRFREAYTGQAMLDHFRATLIRPYAAILRTFDPFPESLRRDHTSAER